MVAELICLRQISNINSVFISWVLVPGFSSTIHLTYK